MIELELLAFSLTDKVFEILLGVIASINIGAYAFLWKKMEENAEEMQKNSETLNMVLQRIFGVDDDIDPTDEGYIMETEEKFEGIENQLEKIADKQEEIRKEQKEDYRRVHEKISSVMRVLAEEERVDIDRSDFEDD